MNDDLTRAPAALVGGLRPLVATKGGAAIHAMDRAGEAPVVPRFKFSL